VDAEFRDHEIEQDAKDAAADGNRQRDHPCWTPCRWLQLDALPTIRQNAAMQIVTGTISGISHLREGWRSRKAVTSFNADIAGARRFDVALPRRALIQEGMTATFVLSTTNNWQTVIALRESAGGRIVLEDMQQEWSVCVFSLVMFYALWSHGAPLASMELLLAFVLVCADVYCINRIAKLLRARRLLAAGAGITH